MAGKGSRKNSKKGAVKQSVNVKRFSFDVLSFTVRACGVPATKLRIKIDIQNQYRDLYLTGIHAAVLSSALSSRDKWKRMFESRQKSSGLDNNEEIQNYLSTIVKVLPQFQAEDSIKTFASLALYSELILFLDFKNIEFDFEEILNMWICCFTETIARNKNVDELFDSLFFGHPNIKVYLDFIRKFIKETAARYGENDISVKFNNFSRVIDAFEAERNGPIDSMRERVIIRLGFIPHNPIPDDVEESVALMSSVLRRDEVLPGDRDSSPEEPRWAPGFRSPSSGAPRRDGRPELGKKDKKRPG